MMKLMYMATWILVLSFSCGTKEEATQLPGWSLTSPTPGRWWVDKGKIRRPNGLLWRGVGSNLTHLMGRDDTFVSQRVRREADMGFSFIRLWTPNHNSQGPADMHARAKQIVRIMDEIASHNMQTMLVLWDTYKDLWGTGHAYHRDRAWFQDGFRQDFLAWVKVLIPYVKDHPSLFMYQFINEASCREKCAQDYLNLYAQTSQLIRNYDDKHLMSPGGLSLAHAIEGGSFAGDRNQFVEAMIQTDDQMVWTNSIYNHQSPNRDDLALIQQRMAIIVTEYGLCAGSNPEAYDPLSAFHDKNWGAKAMFDRWQVSGIAAWEADESDCGYANKKHGKYNLQAEWRQLTKAINLR